MSSLIGRLFHFRPLGKKDTKKVKKRPKTKNIIIPKRKVYTKVNVEGNPYKFPIKTREDEFNESKKTRKDIQEEDQ